MSGSPGSCVPKIACIVHYKNIKEESITRLTEKSHSSLLASKSIRERLGGDNWHKEQCEGIPQVFSDDQGYHRSCYAKFTLAKSYAKRRSSDFAEGVRTDSQRSLRSCDPTASSSAVGTILFPKQCMICKKSTPKSVKGKKQPLSLIVTKQAETTLKQAAALHNDQELLVQIQDQDLIAKELLKHRKCYLDYTRIVGKLVEDKELEDAEVPNKTNFSAVCELVQTNILEFQQSISMETLMTVYGGSKERQNRHLLKDRLSKQFPGQLLFVKTDYHEPHIVISASCIETSAFSPVPLLDKEFYINKAAFILRDEVLDFVKSLPELPWPPTVQSMSAENRLGPELLLNFYKKLLAKKGSHHSSSPQVSSFAESFSQDVLFAVSRGNFLTAKHVLNGCGIHSLTGQKLPISILAKQGHSVTYDTVCEIETSQAELTRVFQKEGASLLLQPKEDSSIVPTFFWWDNFDQNIESMTGHGTIHTTHGEAFQEHCPSSIVRDETRSLTRSKRRALAPITEKPVPQKRVSAHTEPPPLSTGTSVIGIEGNLHCRNLHLLWTFARNVNNNEQTCPRFIGWITRTLQDKEVKKTELTYLPPIHKPITEYGTMFEIFYQSRRLAKQCNMKYTHITMDCGAAMKAYHVLWNNPDTFSDVILHLGDFHAMMEIFNIIGTIVAGSGFEDIIFQAGLCASGSLNGVMKGKHYNRAWMVHESFAEAVVRLFQERCDITLPEGLRRYCHRDWDQREEIGKVLENEEVRNYIKEYDRCQKKCLEGEFGKTAQFWMQYANAVESLHRLRFAICKNDFDLRLLMWQFWLPFMFMTNKVHYSRYGAYYCFLMEHLDANYPGAREEMEMYGLSVKRNNLGIGQAVDLAGEQTFMKHAKTAGGLKQCLNSETAYEKWVLNRPMQAEYTEGLMDLSGLSRSIMNPRKCLRPSEIIKSEEMVKRVQGIITETFVNPFQADLPKDNLYNIVSGRPVDSKIHSDLCTIRQEGEVKLKEFTNRFTGDDSQSHTKKFFDPIKRTKLKTFKESFKSQKKKDGKEKQREIVAQRDVLGLLAAKSYEENAPVDFDKALSYPLSPVPLSLATADGAIRKSAKSKLYQCAFDDLQEVSYAEIPDVKIFILDLAAAVRSTNAKQCTIRQFANRILQAIPHQMEVIYVACDIYSGHSIKEAERKRRGEGERYILNSPDVKVPNDISGFLSNGENKERLFNLIMQTWMEEKYKLGKKVIYFSSKINCHLISKEECKVVEELASNHEEADTKVVFLLDHVLQRYGQHSRVILRSPSGDVDIPIIVYGNQLDTDLRIFLDNGTGKSRKVLDMNSSQLSSVQKRGIIGFHALTGNDYVSSFFGKGKASCYKIYTKFPHLQAAFCNLGNSFTVDEQTKVALREFICKVYGKGRLNDVDEARRELFWNRLRRDNRISDLSVLPPCNRTTEIHIKRANFVALMWKMAKSPMLNLEDPSQHGWTGDLEPDWGTEPYPEDIEQLLVRDNVDAASVDSDEDSDLELEDLDL